MESLDKVIKEDSLDINNKTYECLVSTMNSFKNTKFYAAPCFNNSYDVRQVLEHNLSDRAKADKEAVEMEVAAGILREEAVKPYITDEAFDEWYDSFCKALNDAVEK